MMSQQEDGVAKRLDFAVNAAIRASFENDVRQSKQEFLQAILVVHTASK